MLRQDNADLRLTKLGFQVGLIDEERYEKLIEKERMIAAEEDRLLHTTIGATEKSRNF